MQLHQLISNSFMVEPPPLTKTYIRSCSYSCTEIILTGALVLSFNVHYFEARSAYVEGGCWKLVASTTKLCSG